MAAPSDPSQPKSPAASRRGFMGSIAAAATFFGITRGRSAGAETPGGHTADQIALRDRANVAASRQRRQASASAYQPLTGGIVHFFGYGQSLSQGFDGAPVLSSQQPYDNLMIGGSTRAANNAYTPAATTWVPVGSTDSSGVYPFEPMIATPESPYASTSGETPGEGAINFLRNVYLQQLGLSSNSACQFVLTNCGIGNQTIAELSKGADPEVFNRLRNAASCVQQTAASLGLSYQVGGMIWTHGETDVARNTPYASYLASLQQLQADFLTDIVQAIAGQPSGVTIPWFTDQPDSNHAHHPIGVHQALLDWSNTPNSDLYMAGPVYQYPDRSVHLTANGYRWHANQVGRAMANVILNGQSPTPLCMTSATFQGTSVLINFSVPVPPLIQGDSYIQFTQAIYPALGFIVSDSAGNVPITSAAIVGAATVQIILGRALRQTPSVQSGFNRVSQTDWGTNICDSDLTLGNDLYVYTPGVQLAGEDIATWNGAPLIGQPYPLNNYLAVGAVTITPD